MQINLFIIINIIIIKSVRMQLAHKSVAVFTQCVYCVW